MKVLVTGGAGYIGSHVVKELVRENHEVIVVDNLSTGNSQAVKSAKLIVEDLANTKAIEQILQEHRPQAVMHFAGSIIVPESVEKPLDYYQNNTLNSYNLIKLCLDYQVNNFIFSSTAAVYGSIDNGVAVETLSTNPLNPYGSSKLFTEHMLQDVSQANENFNYVALRYFNVSGADPDGEIGQAFPGATHLIKVNCEAAAGKREKTYIFGTDFETPDGTGIRDYIHVVDLAKAHIAGLNYLQQHKKSQVFNCGYGHGFSVREVVKAVKQITGVDYPVEEAPRRAGDGASLVANVDKIKFYTSWLPKYDDLNLIISHAYQWETSEVFKSWR